MRTATGLATSNGRRRAATIRNAAICDVLDYTGRNDMVLSAELFDTRVWCGPGCCEARERLYCPYGRVGQKVR